MKFIKFISISLFLITASTLMAQQHVGEVTITAIRNSNGNLYIYTTTQSNPVSGCSNARLYVPADTHESVKSFFLAAFLSGKTINPYVYPPCHATSWWNGATAKDTGPIK